MVAESRFTGEYCHAGAAQDLRMIARLLQDRAGTQSQFEKLQRRLLNKTENLLDDKAHATAIELIAKELIAKKTISGRAVKHFFEQAIRQAESG